MRDFTISSAEQGQRLLHYVSRLLPGAAMGLIRKSLRKKNILLNGKKAEGKEILRAGDVVRIFFSDETLEKFMAGGKPQLEEKGDWKDFPKHIIYEDEQVLLLNKPAGLLSQGDGSGVPSLNDGLLSYLKDSIKPGVKPAICNRLDRNTSGLVAAGKTVEALQQLTAAIRGRTLRKEYEAIVVGTLEGGGTLKGFLTKDHAANRVRYSETGVPGAVPIETEYEVLKHISREGAALTLVKVHLITGRSHQIRLHFASIGHPLLGDRKYGSRESLSLSTKLHIKRQMLHAACLTFPKMEGALAPLSGRTFEAPLPGDMREVAYFGQ